MLMPVSAHAGALAFDAADNLYAADPSRHPVFTYMPDGTKSSFVTEDFLQDESATVPVGIRAGFISSLADAGASLEGVEYIRRHFPKTAAIFSQGQYRSVSASKRPSNNSTASRTSTPESEPGKSAIGENDFSVFWQRFKSAVIAGDKEAVAEVTKFPLSMSYLVKAVKNKEDFLRRYDEIFKGEANAAQCFASAEPHKDSDRRYEIYCPFKETPHDMENAPIRFVFKLTKGGWRFVGLDNINE
jgi:hypothetical protein